VSRDPAPADQAVSREPAPVHDGVSHQSAPGDQAVNREPAPVEAWIQTVTWAEATGTLKEAYDWQAASLGEVTEFTQLGSL
jgi:hypothetical protein